MDPVTQSSQTCNTEFIWFALVVLQASVPYMKHILYETYGSYNQHSQGREIAKEKKQKKHFTREINKNLHLSALLT